MSRPLNIAFRGFKLYANDPVDTCGNVPCEICHDSDGQLMYDCSTGEPAIKWQAVTHVGYQGGYNPVYGFSLEDVINRINKMFVKMGNKEARRIREMKAALAEHEAKLVEVNQQISVLESEAQWLSREIEYYKDQLKK